MLRNDAVLSCERLIPLVRLIQKDKKPDHLVRLDQNRNSDADKRQDPGDIEPERAGLIAPAKQRESSRRWTKREQHCRERRRQRIDSQDGNGFSRVTTEIMAAWAAELGLEPAAFAKHLLVYYEPELYRLLFGAKK